LSQNNSTEIQQTTANKCRKPVNAKAKAQMLNFDFGPFTRGL